MMRWPIFFVGKIKYLLNWNINNVGIENALH